MTKPLWPGQSANVETAKPPMPAPKATTSPARVPLPPHISSLFPGMESTTAEKAPAPLPVEPASFAEPLEPVDEDAYVEIKRTLGPTIPTSQAVRDDETQTED